MKILLIHSAKLKEILFIAVAAKSISSFYILKCAFNKLVLNKILYLVVFSLRNRALTAKYTSENLIAE